MRRDEKFVILYKNLQLGTKVVEYERDHTNL